MSVFPAGRLAEGRLEVADLVMNSGDVFDFVDGFELGPEGGVEVDVGVEAKRGASGDRDGALESAGGASDPFRGYGFVLLLDEVEEGTNIDDFGAKSNGEGWWGARGSSITRNVTVQSSRQSSHLLVEGFQLLLLGLLVVPDLSDSFVVMFERFLGSADRLFFVW